MAEVFVIAAVSALDAGLLAAAVVMLGRPQPARQLLAYLIGGMGFSIVIGLLIVLGLHGSSVLRGLDRSTRGVIGVAAGGLLIFIAIAVALGHRMQWHPRRTRQRNADHTPRPSLADRALGHDSLWIAWAAGALYSAPGAEYLAGLALLAKLNASPAASVAAILGFNVIMFAAIELPAPRPRPDARPYPRTHREAQRVDDGPPADADHCGRRSRRELPAHLRAVRPQLNVADGSRAGSGDEPALNDDFGRRPALAEQAGTQAELLVVRSRLGLDFELVADGP